MKLPERERFAPTTRTLNDLPSPLGCVLVAILVQTNDRALRNRMKVAPITVT